MGKTIKKDWNWKLFAIVGLIGIFLIIFALYSFGLVGQPKYIKVVVLGETSPALEDLLKSEDYSISGIVYVGSINPEAFTADMLKGFDVVILYGKRECGITLPRELVDFRKGLTEFVEKGGKLIVVKDACSKTYADQKILGYDELRDSQGTPLIPVAFGEVKNITGRLKMVYLDHPIFNGVVGYNFEDEVAFARALPQGKTLAYIQTEPEKTVIHAIIESEGLRAGKTLYFAFDPATGSRNLFLNALFYLKCGARAPIC
jgi:hypothetical protein